MIRFAIALLALAPTAALAEGFACTMTSECFEADGCSDTAFAFDLTLADELVTLTTDAETFSGALVAREDGATWTSGTSDLAGYAMVIAPDGAARLSVTYFDGPMMIGYLGTCEGLS